MRARISLLPVALVGLVLAGCRTPTSVELLVSTDLPCAEISTTSFAVARQGVESAPDAATTTVCQPDGHIGSLVIVPRSSDDEALQVRVVTAVGAATSCVAPTFGPGCIVSQRQLHFVAHEELSVSVVQQRSCAGKACDGGQTCLDGVCVSSQVEQGACEATPERCGAELRPGARGPGGSAGAGGGSDPGGSAGQGGAGAGGLSGSSGQGEGGAGSGGAAGSAGQGGAGQGGAGQAGLGGVAGEGGAAGTGGLAGEGGAAGTGGVAGEGGVAGTGGVAGEGGAAGPGGAGQAGDSGQGGAGAGGLSGSSGDGGAGGISGASPGGNGGTGQGGLSGSSGQGGSGQGGAAGAAGAPVVAPLALIRSGDAYSCALRQDGLVKCWGNNSFGQLGLGDDVDRGTDPGQMGAALPAVNLGVAAPVKGLGVGRYHACAFWNDGTLKCWGDNSEGQLGLGNVKPRGLLATQMGTKLPAVDLGAGVVVQEMSLGAYTSCARRLDGQVQCWGDNTYGQLGQGDKLARGNEPGEMGASLLPVDLGGGEDARVVQIAVGEYHACALRQDARVQCWGSNYWGQLGLGDTEDRGDQPGEMGANLPFVDLGPGVQVTQITAGRNFNCALRSDGKVQCWGNNESGQLGLGDTFPRGDEPGAMGVNLPTLDLGLGGEVAQVIAGYSQACALGLGGAIQCWGYGGAGLGQGDSDNRGDEPGEMGDQLPLVDLGSGSLVESLSLGGWFGCAVRKNGRAQCWGHNSSGQLGEGNQESRGDGPGEMGSSVPLLDLGP